MLFENCDSGKSWVEISTDKAINNYALIRNRIDETAKICCVVKANAYGNGDVILSKLYEGLGADYLAVANLGEAVRIRRAGISIPILSFGKVVYKDVEIACRYNVTLTVYSKEVFELIFSVAKTRGLSPKVHIKIDTGMNRLGFKVNARNVDTLCKIYSQTYVKVEGIYSHLSCADDISQGKFTLSQIGQFLCVTDTLRDKGFDVGIRHILNSAGIVNYPQYSLDMVRAGVSLYGVKPCFTNLPFQEIASVKGTITQIKHVGRGERISYGGKPLTRGVKVGVIPIGYADGILRRYGGLLKVDVGGKVADVVGAICMDQMTIDLTNVSASVGDQVTILGGSTTVQDLARKIDTIPYEIMTSLSARLPRRQS